MSVNFKRNGLRLGNTLIFALSKMKRLCLMLNTESINFINISISLTFPSKAKGYSYMTLLLTRFITVFCFKGVFGLKLETLECQVANTEPFLYVPC